jgi:hypothetical protein
MSHPLLYEINTRCWLRELSAQKGTAVTLATIPDSEFASWQELGFTHIWLMGVWTSGPKARAKAMENPTQKKQYSDVLPDCRDEDIGASPYAIADYRVPEALGGEDGLQSFRRRLNAKGMKLVLDFVPNHLGLDHAWVSERPELFVQSANETAGTFAQPTNERSRWLAHGKDPYFPPWTDTVQLDYRLEGTRKAMTQLLQGIAKRCDGVRCDMAMLLIQEIFAKTWQHLPVQGAASPSEFWPTAIARVKQMQPAFLFLAEAYWGLEEKLQSFGFDYTYDKELYDLLTTRNVQGPQSYLVGKSREYIARSAHFLENHDEPRIASILNPAEHRAAALLILGLPGMRLLYQGQLSGAAIRIPVQLMRRPAEASRPEIEQMYEQLLTVLRQTSVGQGEAELLRPRPAWPGNPTAGNIVLVQWQRRPSEFDLVIVNLAPHPSQCYAPVRLPADTSTQWELRDLLGNEKYVRSAADLQNQGLYLDLRAHAAQLFRFEPAA